MNMKLGVVLGFVALAAIYVTGCGDNPEKRRVLPSSLEKLKIQFSDKTYISNTGNSFRLFKDNNKVQYDIVIQPQTLYAEANNSQNQLTITNNFGEKLFTLPFEKEKQAPVNGLQNIRSSFTLTCRQVRAGSLSSLFQRPTDLKIGYDNFQVQEIFRSSPSIIMVAAFDIDEDEGSFDSRVSGIKNEEFANTLLSSQARGEFVKLCAKSDGYSASLNQLFSSPSGTSSQTNKLVPIVRFDEVVFQTTDLSLMDEYNPLDASIFSTEAIAIDVLPFAKQNLDADYVSGRVTYEGDKENPTPDGRNIELSFEFDTMTFSLHQFNSLNQCQLNIQGAIQSAVYDTRRKMDFPNTFIVQIAAKDSQINDCIPATLKDKDLDLAAYIAIGHKGEEISVSLLDQQTQTEIVSRQTFIKK